MKHQNSKYLTCYKSLFSQHTLHNIVQVLVLALVIVVVVAAAAALKVVVMIDTGNVLLLPLTQLFLHYLSIFAHSCLVQYHSGCFMRITCKNHNNLTSQTVLFHLCICRDCNLKSLSNIPAVLQLIACQSQDLNSDSWLQNSCLFQYTVLSCYPVSVSQHDTK